MIGAYHAFPMVLFCLCCSTAWGLDLISAYRKALANDAIYQAARATAEASREAIAQASAGLLPSIGYSNNRAHNSTTQTSIGGAAGPQTRDYEYLSKSEAITLRQPLLRLDRVAQYNQAKAQVAAAEATLEKETQMLATRVAGAYFDTVLAAEILNAIQTQKSAYDSQLQLVERSFAAGDATRTDVDEARVRFLIVAAQEIDAQSALSQAERALAAILGEPVSHTRLRRVIDDPPIDPAQQAQRLDDWLQLAEAQSPALQALRYTLQAAEAEIDRNRAQHLPTADLVLAHSYSSSENNTSVGNTYRTDSIGIQLSIPIFSGGYTSSTVRQAIANRERARQQLEEALRQLRVDITKEFNALAQGEARIRALGKAEAAARQLIHSTKKGVQAGIRHLVDVMNAEQQLARAKADLARARIGYVLAGIRLRSVAGVLSEDDIKRINSVLTELPMTYNQHKVSES